MLRLVREAALLTKWTFRFLLLASIGFLLHAYGQTTSSTGAGTGGTYLEDLHALAALKELARTLQ
jgi:hypothetical protein